MDEEIFIEKLSFLRVPKGSTICVELSSTGSMQLSMVTREKLREEIKEKVQGVFDVLFLPQGTKLSVLTPESEDREWNNATPLLPAKEGENHE